MPTWGDSRWLDILGHDPSLTAVSPSAASLPTLHHFADMGIVSARSDWSGNESLVVFKAGPILGAKGMELGYDAGASHVHPDANHFVVFGQGGWIIRNDGYRGKATEQQNTLIVYDGTTKVGQLGDGGTFFLGSPVFNANIPLVDQPKIVTTTAGTEIDYMVGEASRAYPASLGLQKFKRHLVFVKPNVLLVLDDIELGSSKTMGLRFHPEQAASANLDGSLKAGCTSGTAPACLRFDLLTPSGVTTTPTTESAKPFLNVTAAAPFHTIELTKTTDAWRNAVALSWSAYNAAPATVALLEIDDSIYRFKTGDKIITVDIGNDEASISDDTDGDDVGDDRDNCDTVENPDQTDINTNGVGDVCENGLTASFYNNIAMTGTPVAKRIDTNIYNDWGFSSPIPGIVNTDNFSVSWNGRIVPPVTGTYEFCATSDDGMWFSINDQPVATYWNDRVVGTTCGTVNLTAGVSQPIGFDFFDSGDEAVAKLTWSYPGQPTHVPVPNTVLYAK